MGDELKKEAKLLLVGLEGAGKTSILYKLKLGKHVSTIPTIGFNLECVEHKEAEFTIWDIGHHHRFQHLWVNFVCDKQGIIFVIDSSDREGMTKASEELDMILNDEELKDAVLLVLANKQDLPNAMIVQELTAQLGLNKLRQRQWYVIATCAVSGENLYEGLDWIYSTLQITGGLKVKTNEEIEEEDITSEDEDEVTTDVEEIKKEAKLLLLGLDGGGKTTILYKIKLGEKVVTIPTCGFNVETIEWKDAEFTIWDIGGQERLRSLWRQYFPCTQGIIFVVDSTDGERMTEASEELDEMLDNEVLKDAVLLVLANKQDLPNAMTMQELTAQLGLNKLRQRQWNVIGTCAMTGDNLCEGLNWIYNTLQIKEGLKVNMNEGIKEEVIISEENKDEVTTNVEEIKKEAKLLLLGLDGGGKTTILYKIKLGETITSIPTIGFNVETIEYKDAYFTTWDGGGRDKLRALWVHYFPDTQAIIFVVDSTDRERMTKASEELDKILNNEELKDAVLLVLANKQDLPNAMTMQELIAQLGLNKLRQRQWNVFGTCAMTGDNLYEGLDWIYNKVLLTEG